MESESYLHVTLQYPIGLYVGDHKLSSVITEMKWYVELIPSSTLLTTKMQCFDTDTAGWRYL